MFGNSFYKIGYEIADLPKDKNLGMPAYDFIRNINYKKFPNLFEIIYLYYFKLRLKKIIGDFIWRTVAKSNFNKILYLKIILKLKSKIKFLKEKTQL
jgi:hypothetical protein